MANRKCPFPPIHKDEKRRHYVDRCMNMNTVAAVYPNRVKRRKILGEYFDSTSVYERHNWYSPEKYLFPLAAAEYLGITNTTLQYWTRYGYISPGTLKYKKGFRKKIFEIKVLDEIRELRNEIKSKKQKPNSD